MDKKCTASKVKIDNDSFFVKKVGVKISRIERKERILLTFHNLQ